MTSAYSKSCGYKKFSVHTSAKKSIVFKLFHSGKRFQKFRFRGSFYADTSVLDPVHTTPFSNENGTVMLRFQNDSCPH